MVRYQKWTLLIFPFGCYLVTSNSYGFSENHISLFFKQSIPDGPFRQTNGKSITQTYIQFRFNFIIGNKASDSLINSSGCLNAPWKYSYWQIDKSWPKCELNSCNSSLKVFSSGAHGKHRLDIMEISAIYTFMETMKIEIENCFFFHCIQHKFPSSKDRNN